MSESLSHLRVVEIGQHISAPYCSKLLADLGADVIKIEPWTDGDPLRNTGSFPGDPEDWSRGCLFEYLNANKRNLQLDLTTSVNMDILLQILADAHILIENLGYGVMESMDLNPNRLFEVNDHIAIVRINEAVEQIRAQNIPAATTLNASDMYNDLHLQARSFFQEMSNPIAGTKRFPRYPKRQKPGNEGAHRFGPPTLGEHNTEILGKELGLSDEEMNDLAHDEVIGTIPKGIESIQWSGTSGNSQKSKE